MQCRDLREIADSFLNDELLVETNHEVIQHLEGCDDCRSELTARSDSRHNLRRAFMLAPEMQMRDELTARLRSRLQASARRRTGIRGRARAFVSRLRCILTTSFRLH